MSITWDHEKELSIDKNKYLGFHGTIFLDADVMRTVLNCQP